MPYTKWGCIRLWAALCGLMLLPLNLLSHPDHSQLGAPLSTQSAFQHAPNGSFSASTTTNKAQQSSDLRQHEWNANSLAILDPQFTTSLDHIRVTRTLSTFWSPFWSDRLDPFERTVRARGTTRGTAVANMSVSPVQELWGCRRGLLTIFQAFQLHDQLMKFPGIGVAATALEKLHLVTTFIFRGRGLLNLSESRSEVLYTIPYSFNRHLRHTKAKSPTTTMHNNNTTVPVLVFLVVSLTAIANTGFWGSEVLRKLRRQSAQHPRQHRNQREHQRHLPSFLMPLSALHFRFGFHPQYPHSTTLPYPGSLYLTTNISLLCLQ